MNITITSPVTGATQTLTQEQAEKSLVVCAQMIATYRQDARLGNQNAQRSLEKMIALESVIKSAMAS